LTEDITHQRKMEEARMQHEFKMEILRWFTRNRQAPYILMMAGGVGFAYLAKVMSGQTTTPQEDNSFWTQLGEAFKTAAPLGGVAAMLAVIAGDGDSAAYEWTGAGISTLGCTCLLLDAAGGVKGATSMLAAVGA